MATDAPAQSYRLLRKFLPKSMQPAFRGLRKILKRPSDLAEPFHSVYAFTQAHPVRQQNIFRLAGIVDSLGIRGAIVECGVLDGGTAAIMAFGTQRSGRAIHLFDSWEGMPASTAEDGEGGKLWSNDIVGSPRRVAAIMKKLHIDPARIHYHKGWFSDTFSRACIEQVALLHVDGDFYESVKLTLEHWAPRVSSGGFIQIDDYQIFVGCTKAVDEFLLARPDFKLQFVSDEKSVKAFYIECP